MKKGTKVPALVLAAALLFCASMALAGGQGEQGEEVKGDNVIKIGILTPLTGTGASYGPLERIGHEMALEDHNYSVLGRPVSINVVDTEGNPDVGARRARRLLEVDGVDFLLGCTYSSVAMAVIPVAEEFKTPFIATNCNSDVLTGENGSPYAFHVEPDTTMLARASANFLVEEVGTNWFIVSLDYAYGRSLVASYEREAKRVGATIVGKMLVPTGTKEFSTQILQLSNSGADVVINGLGAGATPAFYAQAMQFGLNEKMAFFQGNAEHVFITTTDPATRIGYFNISAHYAETSEMLAMNERYKANYPNATSPVFDVHSYMAWLAMTALLNAIEEVGSTDAEDVIAALEGMVIEDNLRDVPTEIRAWDHHFLSKVSIGRMDPKFPEDILSEYVFGVSGIDVARTKEENPVDLRINK